MFLWVETEILCTTVCWQQNTMKISIEIWLDLDENQTHDSGDGLVGYT